MVMTMMISDIMMMLTTVSSFKINLQYIQMSIKYYVMQTYLVYLYSSGWKESGVVVRSSCHLETLRAKN